MLKVYLVNLRSFLFEIGNDLTRLFDENNDVNYDKRYYYLIDMISNNNFFFNTPFKRNDIIVNDESNFKSSVDKMIENINDVTIKINNIIDNF